MQNIFNDFNLFLLENIFIHLIAVLGRNKYYYVVLIINIIIVVVNIIIVVLIINIIIVVVNIIVVVINITVIVVVIIINIIIKASFFIFL